MSNSLAPDLMSKDLDGSVPSTLLPATYNSLLGWFHFLFEAFLGRYLNALASPTFWEPGYNPGFTFITS